MIYIWAAFTLFVCMANVFLIFKIDRILRGDFTNAELQNFCHNMSESDFDNFCLGCEQYQKRLFGKSKPLRLEAISTGRITYVDAVVVVNETSFIECGFTPEEVKCGIKIK